MTNLLKTTLFFGLIILAGLIFSFSTEIFPVNRASATINPGCSVSFGVVCEQVPDPVCSNPNRPSGAKCSGLERGYVPGINDVVSSAAGSNTPATEGDQCGPDFVTDPSTGVCILPSDLETRSAEDASNSLASSQAQADIGTGLQSAVSKCTGATGTVSSALGSLGNSLGIGNVGGIVSSTIKSAAGNVGSSIGGVAGKAVSTAVGGAANAAGKAAGSAVNSAVGGATNSVSGALNSAVGGATSAITGAVNSIVSGVGGAVGSVFQNLGVSLGSQGIADIGNYLNSFTSDGLSGILGGGGLGSLGSLGGAFSAITGGGGPIPTDPVTASPNIAAIKKKEVCDDAIAYALAHNITLPTAIAQTTNWLNTGNSGNPFYPKNLGDYYQGVANNQTNILLGQIQGSNAPDKNRLIPTVIKANQNQSSNSLANSLEPKLDRLIGAGNAARWRAGDTSVCPGTLYYECLKITALSPADSTLGRQALIYDVSEQAQARAKEEAGQKLVNGFAPQEKCVDERVNEETGDKYCIRYETLTPGIVPAGLAQEVARSTINEAANVNAAGEELGPIFGRMYNQFLSGGLSRLSNSGGIAASISTNNLQARNQVTGAIGTAIQNTRNYGTILSDYGIPVVQGIVTSLSAVSSCYSRADAQLTANNGGNPTQTDKPAASEIAQLPNYQIILVSYQNQLAKVRQNPQTGASDSQINDLSSQVQVLAGKKSAIEDYLSTCKAVLDQASNVNNNSSSNTYYRNDSSGDD